ncbi:hypothetical protein BTR23_22220 [Alkalihalophilus pseudofirmus]|nr:hypothetical protein BTR23_22220 [Alkalihalophilus pseudofirmus]
MFNKTKRLEKRRKKKATKKIKKAFSKGKVAKYHLITRDNGEEKEIKIYPKVESVSFDDENRKLIYEFTIPIGLNPDKVTEKEWVFKQVFGDNAQLDKLNAREFVLTAYPD